MGARGGQGSVGRVATGGQGSKQSGALGGGVLSGRGIRRVGFRTEIEWYPGKNMTQRILKKKPKKGSKNAKPITKTEADELQGQMEHYYDIGKLFSRTIIRDKIIPHVVTGLPSVSATKPDAERSGVTSVQSSPDVEWLWYAGLDLTDNSVTDPARADEARFHRRVL
ncbi:hypothetical protein GUJ93_ZPchr0004g38700 [Zizania palustris]|uniref:Uncharacterized protein n=1 Tax=Zizania palustris TaxID=103762 RepID=A0A8J5S0T5_ZIZPA|nr:hypothetical protein GUJ93_ZPchr0004g38700 [Zizania palustris]